jgi:hypothetical protein
VSDVAGADGYEHYVAKTEEMLQHPMLRSRPDLAVMAYATLALAAAVRELDDNIEGHIAENVAATFEIIEKVVD